MADSKAAPTPAPQEAPMHLDEFLVAHGRREFGVELVGMYRYHALAAGQGTNTASGFRAALAEFARRPAR